MHHSKIESSNGSRWVIHVAVIHRRAVIHVRSASDSDRFLCEARNDAKGHFRTHAPQQNIAIRSAQQEQLGDREASAFAALRLRLLPSHLAYIRLAEHPMDNQRAILQAIAYMNGTFHLDRARTGLPGDAESSSLREIGTA